jgi:hypothetical protein
MRRKFIATLATVGFFWASGAWAACTLETIKACTFTDPAVAEQLLLRALAKDNTPRLLGQVADFYRTAPTVFQNRGKYIAYLRRASSAGDPPSMIAYADLMIKGDGVARDPGGAVKLLMQASKVDPPGPAFTALGKYYLSVNDSKDALAALHDAADHGDPAALALLAALEPDKYPVPPAAQIPAASPAAPNSAPDPLATPAGQVPKATAAEAGLSPDPLATPAQVAARSCVGPAPALPRVAPQPTSTKDPPSTYAGQQLTLLQVLNFAYESGFKDQETLLPVAGLAIAESELWTRARNWKPELGYRDASDIIGVKGPPGAWSLDGRQLQSDRGIWQFSSLWWPEPDSVVDDPVQAAAVVYRVSRGGCDFSPWAGFSSGMAQKHYDLAFDGWPALRPVVKDFLAKKEKTASLPGVAGKS